MGSNDGVPHWSVYDNMKIIPSNPNALMAEINSAISSLQYAKATKFLNPVPPLPKNKKIVDGNKSFSSLYDARMARDAYKSGLASTTWKIDKMTKVWCLLIAFVLLLDKVPIEIILIDFVHNFHASAIEVKVILCKNLQVVSAYYNLKIRTMIHQQFNKTSTIVSIANSAHLHDDFNRFMVIISRVIDLHVTLYRGGFKLHMLELAVLLSMYYNLLTQRSTT
nr:mitochodrial transcription termination factor-related protein [Tanacetum cinerariifolium]